MKKKGIETTVQEVKGKYTVPVPSAIIKLKEIEKGNKFVWKIETDKIIITIERSKNEAEKKPRRRNSDP